MDGKKLTPEEQKLVDSLPEPPIALTSKEAGDENRRALQQFVQEIRYNIMFLMMGKRTPAQVPWAVVSKAADLADDIIKELYPEEPFCDECDCE